jgi:trehalose 6-phosphate synthase/phosphatase
VASRRIQKDRAERPIVVASNRLPFTIQRVGAQLERRPSSGGLISALEPVVRQRGGTWIGWPGTEIRPGERLGGPSVGYHVAAVRLSEHEANRYYHGFSNRTLWPLLHSLPSRAGFDRRDWAVYETVNARFAEIAAEHAGEQALVWIHDYHLMLMPEMLRRLRSDLRAAFFLHVPFPPYDIFRLCPWDRELLRGVLACDLIGFHVAGYALNFVDCVERRLGVRVDRRAMVIEHGDRAVPVGAFPIGIDFALFEETARKAPESTEKGRERIVLGVDRLDYTKGIPERIRAFERFLELHPEHREKVVFLQLAVPSRAQVTEYRLLKREIDELVGRVNGRFASADWSPIRYLYRALPRERLCALYRDADIALITPLRDGMNLVAKEYVVCQVRDPGVLILSRMAGAAETMREALQVNPFDLEETAHAIHRALVMDEEERASRMASLRRRERRDDLNAWVASFLSAAGGSPVALRPLTDEEIHDWLRNFVKRDPLCLFLDYDGTLTPLTDHPSKATLSEDMREALEACARRPDTDVAIVSGRSLEEVRAMVGHEKLIYAGNHGLEIEGPGLASYRHEDLLHYAKRAEELADDLHSIEAYGAWTERKGPTLTFHVRAVAESRRPALVAAAREIVARHGYQHRDAHAALEARPPIGWDKGRAVLHVLRERFGRAWSEHVRVIYVGDDQTDEDAFRFLSGLALTFRVGPADTPTAAARRLPDVRAVEALLGWLARRPPAES